MMNVQNTIARRMRAALPNLSPAERKLARSFLSADSIPPIGTLTELAAHSDVSAPTALRALSKLGFSGFAEFQEVVKNELKQRKMSALGQMVDGDTRAKGADFNAIVAERLGRATQDSLRDLDEGEFSRALDLLSNSSFRQLFAGGRFSNTAAEVLYLHANLLRPGCAMVALEGEQRLNRLIDIGRGHVLTVFDFRRYQQNTINFAELAKRNRAKVVLVTDPWMSPIADIADAVLVVEIESASPFDTLVPAVAMAELLIAGVYDRLQDNAHDRLNEFEELWQKKLPNY